MLLVVTPNYKGEVPELAKTAKALGWEIYNGGWRIPERHLGKQGAVYGEQFFCEAVADQMNWKLLSNQLDWLTKLPEEYTHRKVTFTTLAEARNLKSKKFIKPADDKCFTAKVYESGEELPKHEVLNDAPVIVSDVMSFTSEYRCFVKDRRVVTACCYLYKHYGKDAEINNAVNYYQNNDLVLEFMKKFLKDERVSCVQGSVIDVGRFKKDGAARGQFEFAIIESNPVWASGIYGCEMVAALDSVNAACVPNT